MTSEIVDEMKYTYRLVFSYVTDPCRITLPFVRYKPKQAIFNFEEKLTKENIYKITKLALDLNQAKDCPVEIKEEYFVNEVWTNQDPDTKIDTSIE